MIGSVEVRDGSGRNFLESGTIAQGADLAEWNIRDKEGRDNLILVRFTLQNATPASGADPVPSIRVALDEDAADGNTIGAFEGGGVVDLTFDASENRTSVWIKSPDDDQLYQIIAKFEVT